MSTWLGNWTWISFTLSWYSYLTRKLEMVLHFSAASGYIYSISLESSLLAGCVLTLYDSIQLWRKWPLQQLVKGLQDWHQGHDWKVSKPMSFMCLLGALATCNWLCRRTPNQCGGCLFFVVTVSRWPTWQSYSLCIPLQLLDARQVRRCAIPLQPWIWLVRRR